MKFTRLLITGLSSVYFPVVGVSPTSPFFIKDITGLGPPDVNVVMSNTNHFGAYYHTSIPQLRQIVIRVGIQPDYASDASVETLRSNLYWLMEGKSTSGQSIAFVNGPSGVAYTRGYVSRFEMNPFSKDPEFIVTFNCTETTLRHPTNINLSSANNRLYATPLGTAQAPLIINVHVLKPTTQIGLRRFRVGVTATQEYIAVTGFNYQVGDTVQFTTIRGGKNLVLIRGGNYFNHMGYLAPFSDWPMFDPFVENMIEGWGPGNPNVPGDVRLDITYQPRYWGI